MRSEAQKRADKKYYAKTYKKLQINAKKEDVALIDAYCKSTDISKASFIVNACKYCIDNSINLSTVQDSVSDDIPLESNIETED